METRSAKKRQRSPPATTSGCVAYNGGGNSDRKKTTSTAPKIKETTSASVSVVSANVFPVNQDPVPSEEFPVSAKNKNSTTISSDEVELYDRQIRLWGLQAQERLRSASLLLIGMTGLTNEVIKNLTLAGVGSITLLDPGSESEQMVKEHDLGAQFFLRFGDVGKPRVACIASRAQVLNPRVAVRCIQYQDIYPDHENGHLGNISSTTINVLDLPETFLSVYDIIYYDPSKCTSGNILANMIYLNSVCRNFGQKFWSCGIAGFYGFLFADLGATHDFTTEVKISKDGEANEFNKTKYSSKFYSLNSALSFKFPSTSIDLTNLRTLRKFKQANSPVLFAFLVIWEFFNKHGCSPKLPKDESRLLLIKEHVLIERHNVDATFLINELLFNVVNSLHSDLMPSCAILGGLVSQEILKVISARDAPYRNFFVLDALNAEGKVMTFGD